MINPRESPSWPTAPDGLDDAAVERYKAQLTETGARRAAFDTANHESRVAVEAAQIDILKGSLERARDSAKTVQTSATGIAGLYTGLAALVFSVSDKGKPLPVRGVIPVMFLGGAIVFASVFLGWFGEGATVGPFPSPVDPVALRVERVNWLSNWVTLSVLTKAWSLRLATLFLAGGLIFLPAAFVSVNSPSKAPAAVSTAKVVEWPSVPPNASAADRILFKAQVAETAKARVEAKSNSTSGTASSGFKLPEQAIWIAALVFFLLAVGAVSSQQSYGDLRKALNAAGA